MKAIIFARIFFTVSSVLLLLVIMLFFSMGPLLGVPLDYDQSFSVVKQIAPIFIGYLAQCAYYIIREFKNEIKLRASDTGLFYIISISPFIIFLSVFTSVIFVFISSNSDGAAPGTGMSFERFTDWIAILLGLFTATISVLTAWLFGESK